MTTRPETTANPMRTRNGIFCHAVSLTRAAGKRGGVRTANTSTIDSARREHKPASRAARAVGDVPALEPRPGSLAARYAHALEGHHPATVFISAALLGYVCLVACTVALGFLITEVLITTGGIGHDDEHVVVWLASHRSPGRTEASLIGSIIAGGVVIPTVVGVVAVVLACLRKWRAAAFLIAAIGLEAATYRLTIVFVHRDRPDVPRLEHLQANASYPSGHTAAAIAVYAGLALLITSRFRNRVLAVLCWSIAILVPIFVAFARMYRGMHHPLDSAAAALMGIAALLIALFAARAAGARA
jgi:membrane-associated phospholipid phosphatase